MLKPYIAPGRAARQTPRAATVEPGEINAHRQLVVRRAGRNSSGMAGQSVYVLKCQRPNCGFEYGEEGIRVHQRRCPRCDEGKPGLPVPEREPTLFG